MIWYLAAGGAALLASCQDECRRCTAPYNSTRHQVGRSTQGYGDLLSIVVTTPGQLGVIACHCDLDLGGLQAIMCTVRVQRNYCCLRNAGLAGVGEIYHDVYSLGKVLLRLLTFNQRLEPPFAK